MWYRDMTFCTFYKHCKDGETCSSALTDETIERAAKWWGSKDAPISKSMHLPDCYKSTKGNPELSGISGMLKPDHHKATKGNKSK